MFRMKVFFENKENVHISDNLQISRTLLCEILIVYSASSNLYKNFFKEIDSYKCISGGLHYISK